MRKYKTKEVAEILHVSNNTIYRIIKSLPEQLKPKKSDDGVYEFTTEDLSALRKAVELKATGLTYKEVKETLIKIANVKKVNDEVSKETRQIEESEEIMGMDLTVINQDGKLLVDSREVARMIDKEHKNLLRDIKGYADILEISSKLSTSNFFIESTFKDSYDRKQPCYLLTRKGCDMVANKMTGEKGVIFTAKYVTKFEEMEKQQQAPMRHLSPQLQLLINMELKQTEMETAITEANTRIDGLKDVISLDTTSWRTDTKDLIIKMARRLGGHEHIRDLRKQSYELLNLRMCVSVETRLTNKRRRMADEGASKSRRDKLNLLDVIAEDKKLIEGYVAIVKEMAIKYGVAN